MVGTIIPMVHGERASCRRAVSGLLHLLGSVAGSVLMGASLGTLGALIPWSWLAWDRPAALLATPGLIALSYSARELGLLRVPYLQIRRQVPSKWRYVLPPRLVAALYGVILGFAFGTRIPVATLYVVGIWIILRGDPVLGAVVMAPFGIGRSLPIILIERLQERYDESFQVNQYLRLWSSVVPLANGALLALVGAYLLGFGMHFLSTW